MNTHFTKGYLAATFLVVFSVLCMAACGSTSLSAADILHDSQHAALKDATFDVLFNVSAAGVTANFTGNGKLTQTPNRSEISLSAPISGTTISVEAITDGNDTYSKTTPSTTTKWTKGTTTDGSGLGFDPSMLSSYNSLKNPSLVGTETINGYRAYHLRGNVPAPTPTAGSTTTGGTTGVMNIWVRTDNFFPLKFIVGFSAPGNTTGAADGLITVTFKTWNTGITISVPPPSDVTTGP